MSRDDAAGLRRQLARLLARGTVREDQQEIGRLVQSIHDRTHANPRAILETACTDAADLLIEGDAYVTETIAQQIAAYQQMTVAQLKAEYEHLFGQPPRCRNRTWLWRNCAWKLQERETGGLPPDAAARLEQIIDEHIRPMVAAGAGKPRHDLQPGTVVTRSWHGREVRLVVTETSFVVDGVPHTSLSSAAHAVTGQHWSGRLFWGLRTRAAKERAR